MPLDDLQAELRARKPMLAREHQVAESGVFGSVARDEDLRRNHPDIPWSEMAGLRDKLIHGYATVDLDIVWTTVVEDLPELRAHLIELKGNLKL